MDNFEEIPGFRGATRWYQRGGHFFVVFRSSGLSTYLRCHTHRCPVAWVLRAGQPGPIQGEHDHEPTPWVRNRNNLFQALKRRASSEATPLSAIYEEEADRYPDAVPYLLYESVVSSMRTWRRSVVPPVPRTLEDLRILNTIVPNPGSSSTYLRSTDGLPAIKPEGDTLNESEDVVHNIEEMLVEDGNISPLVLNIEAAEHEDEVEVPFHQPVLLEEIEPLQSQLEPLTTPTADRARRTREHRRSVRASRAPTAQPSVSHQTPPAPQVQSARSALDEYRKMVIKIEQLKAQTALENAQAANKNAQAAHETAVAINTLSQSFKLIAESIDRMSRQYCASQQIQQQPE